MDRRSILIGLGCLGAFAARATPRTLAAQARQGGVLLLRHASTEPGLGDPPGVTLGQCRTQRNLSAAGRAEAQAIGEWFRRHGLRAQAVRSSQWCRCLDTARLAFGHVEEWPALNSTFDGQGQPEQQLRALRDRLQQLPPQKLEVWVTHQVIMTALTDAYPSMGEGFLIDDLGRLRARGMMRPDA